MSSTWEDKQIERAISVAKMVLSGEIDLIEGCKTLNELRWDLDSDGLDHHYDPFVAFESELPLLPSAESRHLWNPAHLAKLEAQAQQFAVDSRDEIFEACRRLLRSYGHERPG